jgi:DNA-directed RNA polymerase specialized sigma24 family protein
MSGSAFSCVYALIARTAMSPDAQKSEIQARLSEPEVRERVTEVCKRDFRKLVTLVIRRLSRDAGDKRDVAEEIVAQSLLQVLLKGPLQSVPRISAYWRATVENALRNLFRHADMRRRIAAALAYEHSPEPSLESSYLERELMQERKRVLQQVIENLPARTRMAFQLRVWEELETREIVARLAVEGIEVSERQVLRYVEAGWEACDRALEAYEAGKEGIR